MCAEHPPFVSVPEAALASLDLTAKAEAGGQCVDFVDRSQADSFARDDQVVQEVGERVHAWPGGYVLVDNHPVRRDASECVARMIRAPRGTRCNTSTIVTTSNARCETRLNSSRSCTVTRAGLDRVSVASDLAAVAIAAALTS